MSTQKKRGKTGQPRTEQAPDVTTEEIFLSEINMESIMEGLFQGLDAATMLGWRPEETENFYALAYQHYVAGDFESAQPVFQMLCKLKSGDARFWMGYGGCLQGLTRYREAIDAYSMAAVGERFGSPLPFLHVASCFVLLQEKKNARTVLDSLLVMGDTNNPTHAACHEKARHMLRMLAA